MNDKIIKARVIAEHRELYRVKSSYGEYLARVTGKHMHKSGNREDFPAVGDFVIIEILDDDQAMIREVLPRKSLIRKRHGSSIQIVAANVDTAFIVESLNHDYNLNRLERYRVLCEEANIQPVVVLNKTDLIFADELQEKIREVKSRLKDIEVIPASTTTAGGLAQIEQSIQSDMTYCFLGSSGVGKSTIINRLIGRESMRTGAIGEKTERGKHTTTHREMFFLENGGILIDNPGMREVGLADFEKGIEKVFDDIPTLAKECKFSDCTHINEPDCAVLGALRNGRLDRAQYENYLSLRKEVDFYELEDHERREKDRKFGKMVKNVLKQKNDLDRC
jgi:ribosome biogenesis GTPase